MRLDDWHLVLVSVCLVLVVAACAPVVMAFLPGREEPFFALAVLGEGGMAERYYPGDDPRIEVGEEVRWTIYVYNHMGEAKYLGVKVRLLNSTMLAPNSTFCSPSPAPVVFEIRRVLMNNETWLYPFSWSIKEARFSGDFLELRSFTINDRVIEVQAMAFGSLNFRFIIELWVYDEASEDFIFGWASGQESRCAWNQVWFNVTLAG